MDGRRRSSRLQQQNASALNIPKVESSQKIVKTKKPPAKRAAPAKKKNEPVIQVLEDPPEIETPRVAPEPEIPVEAPPTSSTSNRRPRRSTVIQKKISYAQKDDLEELMEMSSSSSSASDSEDEMTLAFSPEPPKNPKKRVSTSPSAATAKKRSKAIEIQLSESSSDSYESEGSEEESDSDKPGPSSRLPTKKLGKSRNFGGKKKKTGNETDKGDVNWPKCSKASIARKTGNPAGSRQVKSGLRMAVKPKPPQPWKKNLSNYEADRKLAKGERRMREYRIVAHTFARGKIEEVSYDECFKIHEKMKKAYLEGRKIIEALENESERLEILQKNSEKMEKLDESNEDSSEDEWEEMEHFHPILDEKLEVQLDDEDENEEGVEKDWWVVYLRQEVNKKIRESWENTHKVHILCFLAHLKSVVKTALDEDLVPSLMISQLPSGYHQYIGEPIPSDILLKLLRWFSDAFRPLNGVISIAAIEQDLLNGHEARFPATSRLTAMVDGKCYETDLDRATLLFCLLRSLDATVRICVNARVIPRKWDKNQQKSLQEEIDRFRELSRSPSGDPEDVGQNSDGKSTKKPKKSKNESSERNYWVEYWNPREKRWISVDPLRKTVDEPLTIHSDCAKPISYVFAIDNNRGICEVSQRYAMDCVKQEFRRRRTDPNWISWTLSLPQFAANSQRQKWEVMQMREDLVKRPLPTVMSEYKNHPLYVLEKDLLKFEAIYPPPSSQKPLGQIRGHSVYPRSTVFTLQGENNWLKLARSVKIGEKAYKVVKARPDPRIPAEDRVDQFLDVFGYWQTEPYRRPGLKKGKIPCNEYGNVYMFNERMCPLECVHLKLTGLVQISRKLDKQCVPAVVGWAFDGGWTHPVMDGAIVLEKDAAAFRKEWNRIEAGRAEKEEKARRDRILENWRKLIKGKLRLAYVKRQFGANSKTKLKISKNDEKSEENDEPGPSEIIDNGVKINPLDGFSLDDFISRKK